MLVSSNPALASLSVNFSIAMRVIVKVGCAKSLSRVAVVLVTGCGVGVARTTSDATATWFPRSCCGYCESGLELRLRLSVISGEREGSCDAFGLWFCVLRIWTLKSRRVYLVVVVMFCIALVIDYCSLAFIFIHSVRGIGIVLVDACKTI
ncbi:uncharacterized protein LOC130940384 [Arachis stenosperma]|uniref:uncharacterized protein LOC130940384 n=1 Tax=Arachis stenosperma TaxID=217475 RepID=UPI0025ABF9C3|nr:uncharacterized protein LOC130940384 [Arachis stenosperma]